MRSYLIGVLFLVGCGGGGGKPNLVDAAVDAPPAFTCGLPASLGSGNADLATVPVMAQKTMAGNLAFGIVLTLNDPGQPTQGIFLVMVDKQGMFATGATAGPFVTAPSPKLNTAAKLNVGSMPAATACGGCMEGYSGYMQSGGSIMLGTATQGFFNVDMTGTLTLTAWAPATNPGGTSTIAGSYDNITLKGADLVTMQDTTCVTTITKVGFTNFKVTWPNPLLQEPPPGDGPYGLDMSLIPQVPVKFD